MCISTIFFFYSLSVTWYNKFGQYKLNLIKSTTLYNRYRNSLKGRRHVSTRCHSYAVDALIQGLGCSLLGDINRSMPWFKGICCVYKSFKLIRFLNVVSKLFFDINYILLITICAQRIMSMHLNLNYTNCNFFFISSL